MTTQIAVRLSDELMPAADCLIEDGVFPSRSELVRRGIEAVVDGERRRAIDAAYAAGYEDLPETPGELIEAERLAVHSFVGEPWDRWW